MTTPDEGRPPMDPQAGMAADCDAYFRPLDQGRWHDVDGQEVSAQDAHQAGVTRTARYAPSLHAQGAWLPHEQHMAPVSGLLVHELEQFAPRDTLQFSRFTYDILGVIAARPFVVTTRVLRPGATIELLEATLSVDDRAAVRCQAWRLLRGDTSAIAGCSIEPLEHPEDLPLWNGSHMWEGGYVRSLDFRTTRDTAPGHGQGWITTDVPLVEGVPVSDLARFVGVVDTANGIGVRVPPTEWMFPNTDLTIHLFRQPKDRWVGFDTYATIGPDGVGLTSSTLYDVDGPVGKAEQILTVRPLPGRPPSGTSA